MALPDEIDSALSGHTLTPVSLGESGAAVWRCTREGSASSYLKVAPLAALLHLDREAERLRWMGERGVSVPVTRAYLRDDESEYLLIGEIAGTPASDARWLSLPRDAASALGDALAQLHQTDIGGCPFDHRVSVQLDEVRTRIAAGVVNEGDFDDSRAGRRAHELFAELLQAIPAQEDLVFTHGDYSLPNIILDHSPDGAVRVTGFIDCGRAGVADRYQDIALAIRSIIYNFGAGCVAPFLAAYGLPRPDPAKVAFYTMLDEFF